MSETTHISWCDHTFNPWIGCTKVSPGCANCYAERQDKHRKWTAEGWGAGQPRKRTSKTTWKQPLKWDRQAKEAGVRRRVFCASLADVFDLEVPQAWLQDLLNLIQQTPNLDWLLLTKRPQNFWRMLPENFMRDFPNVMLGVSVENQEVAKERILPLLRATQGERAFLSVEPLLGPLDLSEWIKPMTPWDPKKTPATWEEFTWPKWVPEKWQKNIEDFWATKQGRGPKAYQEDCFHRGIPPFGQGMRSMEFGKEISGRHVHTWNNMCILVGDDGEARVTSAPRTGLWDSTSRRYWQPISWVIVGGESGSGARPMHPDWVRSIRDQCIAADVPFHFKQWGVYGPSAYDMVDEIDVFRQFTDKNHWINKATSWAQKGDACLDANGKRLFCGADFESAQYPVTLMRNNGTRNSARELDGEEHNGFPAPMGGE